MKSGLAIRQNFLKIMSLRNKTEEIIRTSLSELGDSNSRVFCTSSFQTQSVPLLHIIGESFPDISIIFLDTGFLFPETYSFKNELVKKFGINIVVLKSDIPYSAQKSNDLFKYVTDPDLCCYINKVKPLEVFLRKGDLLLSGIRKDQSKHRSGKQLLEESEKGYYKIHPMLDWTRLDINNYMEVNNLPKHPLEKEGYLSIGCVPCTTPPKNGDIRDGRWQGSNKTECGLHLNYNKT